MHSTTLDIIDGHTRVHKLHWFPTNPPPISSIPTSYNLVADFVFFMKEEFVVPLSPEAGPIG
jgi:hypothetical protein